MKIRSFLMATAAIGLTHVVSQPASAQTQTPSGEEVVTPPDDDATSGDSIIVTGSRIRRPNLESTVPIQSVSGQEFFETGQTSVGDILNELPSLRSTFSQSNSTRFLGTTGLNLLDLRGLGTQRTLVLVNGRRHVGADILSNAVSPDINTFPTDLIERVDVVTGGNSAIYGSDAIAGVVNFVLKDHYEGIQLRGQGGASSYGDAGSYYGSVLAGTNFADDRGNIAINAEYAHQSAFFASDRPNLRNNNGFVIVDTDPSGSDGVPDRIFVRDIRSSTISLGGLVSFASGANRFPVPAGSPPGTLGVINPNAGICGRDAAQAPFNCTFVFQPDGTLVPQTGGRVGISPNGSYAGGNGSTGREQDIIYVQPRQDRYSVNLIGHFEISPAFVPFVEAKYVRTDQRGNQSGPAFTQGTTFGVGSAEQLRLDNPFLTAQARAVITQQLLAANPLANVGNSGRFALRRNLLDLGSRSEESKRETYRVVAGVRGDLGGNWNYEISGNYGEFKEATKVLGNLNIQRYLLATDATRNGAGNIVCRAQTNGGATAIDYGNTPSQAVLDADIAACVPLNPFGFGNISEAARNYVIQDTISRGKITQLVVNGFVSGDSSKWFQLPGGPVGIAVGGEYRRETARFREDPLVENGYTFYNAIPSFTPPSFEVKEAFGEIRLPILKDVPFFQELTLSAAGRIADYKGSTGTVYSYNGGVDWSPIKDFRVRANYSRAVRAPNSTDLFTPLGQNFAPGFVDPCSARNIGTGSANRTANCAAAGIPTSYDFVPLQSLQTVSGGNTELQEEKSDSYTLGAVYTPEFAPGLSLSVDYFSISVKDVITAPTAQQIANACYDSADLTNQFCALFERNPLPNEADGSGNGPNGEVQYQIIEGSLQQVLLNYAKLKVRGIDTEIAYRKAIDGFGELSARFVYTHVLQNDSFLDPTDPGRADQTLLELGDPKDAFNFDASLKTGPFTFGYQFRYIGKQVINEYEDFFSKQGRDPENADYSDIRFYKAVGYHDFRLGIDATERFNMYIGVDNAFNRQPPLGASGVGAGSGIYDPRGRFFYAGAVAKF